MAADLARAGRRPARRTARRPNNASPRDRDPRGTCTQAVPVTLSLEMFEPRRPPSLDTYVAGASAEERFLKGARPWPRYATDYRPLVEFAKSQRWPVVAANVPRRIASDVAKGGRPAVDSLPPADRRLAASDLQCPHDGYFDRFVEQMGGHPPSASGATADSTTERYYWAQCVKDEPMAESIAAAFAKKKGRPGVVVHVTGAFPQRFRRRTGERVRRRLQGRASPLSSLVPVEALDGIAQPAMIGSARTIW